ncbi:MAG: thioredoxin family protein [Pseudomonadota bacterium]
MNRRTFIATTSALALTGFAASAATTLDYTPGAVDAALAEGKTVFVGFSADWCSTCKRQERVIGQLRGENPDYNEMVFIRVDWDQYRTADITRRLDVPRRSTLVVLKGDQEIGRVIAGTSKKSIQDLMDQGIAAASA